MLKILLTLLLIFSAAGAPQAQAPAGQAKLQLWRLDCGSIDVDLASFSDTGLYAGERRTLSASCYLVRNGDRLLLWDTGLDASLAGKAKDAEGSFLRERLVPQLARIGVAPEQVNFVGISHYHYDHIGQVGDFAGARLLIGKRDFEIINSRDSLKARFQPWLAAGSVDEISGDKDVFGDGRVTILALPGHTPGHSALLVRLASGPVILSGDQYHFLEQIANRGVPTFNADRADTLASHDRLDRLVKNINARLIIQHEPRDIAKLPAFPSPAE